MSNITLPNGYTMQTTFFSDFTIADKFGLNAIKQTFDNAFRSYKYNHVYLTEIAIVTSNKSCEWYGKNEQYMNLYAECYHKVDDWCMKHLKADELEYYLNATD